MTPSFSFARHRQIDDYHCGPAVLQMLLEHIGFFLTQKEIAQAAGITDTIQEHGTRIDHMAKAIQSRVPEAQIWAKEQTSREDLEQLISLFGYPVGVEWQNLFYSSIEEEWEDTNGQPAQHDFGHYSIVNFVDPEADEIVMIDPYHEFTDRYRYFSLRWFESRWWDYNEITSSDHHTAVKKDSRLSFIVTIKGMPFPKMLGYKPVL